MHEPFWFHICFFYAFLSPAGPKILFPSTCAGHQPDHEEASQALHEGQGDQGAAHSIGCILLGHQLPGVQGQLDLVFQGSPPQPLHLWSPLERVHAQWTPHAPEHQPLPGGVQDEGHEVHEGPEGHEVHEELSGHEGPEDHEGHEGHEEP